MTIIILVVQIIENLDNRISDKWGCTVLSFFSNEIIVSTMFENINAIINILH